MQPLYFLRAQFIQEFIQGTSFFLTNTNLNGWIWPEWNNTDKKERIYNNDIYSYTPSDTNFQTILMPKGILENILSEKSWSLEPFLS